MLTLLRCQPRLALIASCVLALAAMAMPARAEIPPTVEAMIREAARIGNVTTVAAVVEVAKSMNPEQAEEIGKFGETFMAIAAPVPIVVPLHPALSPEVEAMIREAAHTGNAGTLAAVVSVAKAAHPEDAPAIDQLGTTLLALAPRPAIAPPVEAMVREAGRIGDATTLASVVKVAKSNDPEEAGAIDALGVKLMGDIQTKAREAAAKAREAEIARLASLGTFDGWSGQGEAGFGVTTGNTSQRTALIGLKLAKDGLRARHKFAAALDYQETDGLRTRERYAVSYGLNYLLGEGLYLSSSLGWERDEFAGFARRFTESLGVGVRLIDRTGMTLDIDGGPALRQTRFTNDQSDNEFGARGSLTYRWTIRDGFTFSEDASVVTSDGNTTLISATALTAKLTSFISTRMSFNVQSETQPLPGRQATDTVTRASIVYSF
jgi:putative salt-induced outer membrane protein